MSRKINLSNLSETDKAYLSARPWLLTDEVRAALTEPEIESEDQGGDNGGDDNGGDEDNPEEPNYSNLTKRQLRGLLKKRGLDYSDGNVDELVTRLTEADNAADEEGNDQEE